MRIGIVLLAFLIVIQSGGIILICQIEQAYFKFSFDKFENQTEVISISNAEYDKNITEDNEIWINNNLYDVIKVTKTSSCLLLTVFNDKHEAETIGLIKSILTDPLKTGDKTGCSLFKLIKLFYDYVSSTGYNQSVLSVSTFFGKIKCSPFNLYFNKNTPPPEF